MTLAEMLAKHPVTFIWTVIVFALLLAGVFLIGN